MRLSLRAPLSLAVLGFVLDAAPASVRAEQSATPAAKSASTAAEATHVVVLKDGKRIACVGPPVVAFGRVVYQSPHGIKHALAQDLVDLDATRPAAPAPPAPGAVLPGHAGAQQAPAGVAGSLGARRPAPDFEASRADGTKVKLSSLRGKVVLVDFWATWCGPCRAEMPTVKKAYDDLKARGFEILGVSLDRDAAAMAAYARSLGMTWPQYFDGKGWGNAVARQYGVGSIPFAVLVDRDGTIARAGLRGPLLAPAVEQLLDARSP